MEEFFFKGVWRMDWGLGNPNKTAALIASLMVGLWALSYVCRCGFWVALAGFAGLGVCMVHTFSRGGFIAVVCGLTPVLLMAPRPWPWRRIIGVMVAVWVIVGASVYLQAHERLGQGVGRADRSITNRLELWKSAPAMMLDAPGGWGFGNSGRAFMEWYQPLDRNEPYRTMVNSHLTWLVEFGWVGRFLYLAGWLWVFALCWPDARSRWLAIPFGMWLAFLVSAIFSSVAEESWVWVLPALALLAVWAWRWKVAVWPRPIAWVLPPVAAAVALLMLPAIWQGSEIQRVRSAVVTGQCPPAVWVVVDEKVLGANYARSLRAFWREQGEACVGIVSDLRDLPSVAGAEVILTGRFSSAPSQKDLGNLTGASSILLVNPALYPQELGDFGELAGRITVAIGDFAQNPAALAWARKFGAQRIGGAGDFVPDWPAKLLHKVNEPP